MVIGLSILALLISLVIASVAIWTLARRTGHGLLVAASGAGLALAGLAAFFWLPGLLPLRYIRYTELLAFGTAYSGQALVLGWLALKPWPLTAGPEKEHL